MPCLQPHLLRHNQTQQQQQESKKVLILELKIERWSCTGRWSEDYYYYYYYYYWKRNDSLVDATVSWVTEFGFPLAASFWLVACDIPYGDVGWRLGLPRLCLLFVERLAAMLIFQRRLLEARTVHFGEIIQGKESFGAGWRTDQLEAANSQSIDIDNGTIWVCVANKQYKACIWSKTHSNSAWFLKWQWRPTTFFQPREVINLLFKM